MKIISGGQIGVDLGALLGAKECGIETGGTAPPGWISGGISKEALLKFYGLVEGEPDPKIYPKRTMKNVDDSDGTVVILPTGITSIGTMMTLGYAQTHKWRWYNEKDKSHYKPFALIKSNNIFAAAQIINFFITDNNLKIINFAGPKESSCIGIQEFTRQVIHLINTIHG